MPQVTVRATWQAKIDQLRVKEKAHNTRAGDALAAERRRLPMVEVDPTTNLIGADGPVPLIDTTHINELSCLNSRTVSYATFCQGPYEESSRYRGFMGRLLRTPVPVGAAGWPTSQDN